MTWRCLITEATTGVIVDEVFLTGDPDWSTEIGTKGSWGADVFLGTGGNTTDNVIPYATTGRYAWVLVHDNTPIQGGVPTGATFEQATRTLHVSGPGIGNLLENRIVRKANGLPSTLTSSTNNISWTGYTQRRVMRELVNNSISDTNSGGGLPFDLTDAASETGSVTAAYAGWDFTSVWKALTDISETDGGPEFIIRPYFTTVGGAPAIGWKLALGSPLLGDANLAAAWELGAAFGNIDVDFNCSIPIPHHVWAKGSGDGGSAVIGFAGNSAALQAAGIPYADYVDTGHSDIGVKATLDNYASQDLTQFSVAQSTWTASVRIDGKNARGVQISPALGSWVEGDSPLFRVTGHPVIPNGSYRRRIVGMSKGSEPGTVDLKIQPTPL